MTLDEIIEKLKYITRNHDEGAPEDVIAADLDELMEPIADYLNERED